MICVETSTGVSPSLRQTNSSTSGGTLACVPTAPEIFPTATCSRASSRRRSALRVSATQPASLKPKVVGSAWMPWVRPIITVSLCLTACLERAASSFSKSLRIRATASRSWSESAVSMTSEEVSPRCMKRDSSPRLSATDRRKEITSWWLTAMISSMRLRS